MTSTKPIGPMVARTGAVKFDFQTVCDIMAIDQLLTLTRFEADRRNFEGVAALFTPTGGYEICQRNSASGRYDPINDGAGCVAQGREQIVAFLTEVYDTVLGEHQLYPFPSPPIYHVITNRLIQVDGNHATLHGYKNDSSTGAVVGTYDCTYTRTDDGWLCEWLRSIYDAPISGWPVFPR